MIENIRCFDEFIIKRAERWWQKAKQERNPFDKYIAGWISFNTIYNLISRRKRGLAQNTLNSEKNRVTFAVKQIWDTYNLEINGKLRNSIEALINFPPIGYRVRPMEGNWRDTSDIISNVDRALHNLDNNNIPSDVLVTICEVLYHVRCNLFHGEKNEEMDI